MPLQIRRGTTTQRTAIVPLPGELIYDTTTGGIYVGNGTTAGGIAAVNISPGDIRNVSAAMFTTGVHTGISFTYEPSYNRINATISPDLSNYQGVIRASAFQGTIVGDDSTIIIDGLTNKIQLDGTVKGNIVPSTDSAYDIGSSSRKFKDLYLSGSSIYLGSATITSTGSIVNLPAGSKVGGVVIGGGSGDGVVDGSNYRINIVGANSSVIVDSDNNSLRGNIKAFDGTTAYNASSKGFTGSLVGNVTGNLVSTNTGSTVLNTSSATALFTGAVTGNVTGDVKGNVLASDNSVVFNASTKTFAGSFNGNVTGDVTKTGFSTLNVTAENGGLVLKATNLSGNNGDGDITFITEGKGSAYLKGVTTAFSGAFEGAWFKLLGSRTSVSSPTAVQPGDIFGGLEGLGWNGNKYAYAGFAGFTVLPTGTVNPASSYLPSAFIVNVSNGSSIDLNNVLAFTADGALSAPIIAPTAFASTTARDTFITAPYPGMIVYVSNISKFTGYVDNTGSGPGWVNLN